MFFEDNGNVLGKVGREGRGGGGGGERLGGLKPNKFEVSRQVGF